MNLTKSTLCGCLLIAATGAANAAPVHLDISATIADVSGSYLGNLSVGDSMDGAFIFDTDESNASSVDTVGSSVEGHEYTSFYDFSGPAYGVSVNHAGYSFSSTVPVGVVVNNDLALTSAETNGAISDGTYDWVEILGSTTTDVSGPHTPGNGEEWTLALIADDANWFTDGTVIPDSLPGSYTALLIGIDFDALGNEVGFTFATVDSIATSSVPVPAAVWLFASGLLGLIGVAKRKKAA